MPAEKRVFLALPLPPEFKNRLEGAVNDFKQQVWKTGLEPRWLGKESWHLTILPPQNWTDSQIQEVQQILQQELLTQAFALATQKITSAPPGQIKRMFWLEFNPRQEFFNLREEVWQLLAKRQLAAGKSPFNTIHLTLAKFPEQKLADLPEQKLAAAFQADKIELWQSTPTPQGAEYTSLASIPLKQQK